MMMIRAMVEKEKPAKIATVGDRVTQDLTRNELFPDVLIIDNRVMRKEITPISAGVTGFGFALRSLET